MSEQSDAAIENAAWRVGQAAEAVAQQILQYHATWAAVMKPTLTKDGNTWCALHGENLQVGIVGFGPTPAHALMAFDAAMCSVDGSHHIEARK